MNDTLTDRPSGRHPINIGHLVMGLAFLGIVGVWALVQTDTVNGDDIRWLMPIPWVLAGAVGLVATAITGPRRYAVRQTGWVGAQPEQPGGRGAREPVEPVDRPPEVPETTRPRGAGMTTDPTSQQTDQPPSQPTAQPTPPPASPNADQQYASSVNERRRARLVRRTDDKVLGGVCAGLADHLGLDPTLVRVLTVLVTVLGFGSVIIAYLVAWVIVPKDVDVYAVSPTPVPASPSTAEPLAGLLGGPRVADQQGRVGVVAEQPVDAGVQQHPDLGVDQGRAAGVVVAHRPGQHLQPRQVRLLDQGRPGQQPAAGHAQHVGVPRDRPKPVVAAQVVVGRGVTDRDQVVRGAGGLDQLHQRQVGAVPEPAQVRGLEGLEHHPGVAPVQAVVAQGGEDGVLERQPDRGEVRRRLELDVQPDLAVPAPGLLGQQQEQLVEGGDLEPAVPPGVARPPLGQPLDGAQRLQLRQREVLAEPAAHLAAVEHLDGAPVGELRVPRHVGGVADLGLVAQHGDAVRGHHDVRLHGLGAQRDRQAVRRQRVLGSVAGSTPVPDHLRQRACHPTNREVACADDWLRGPECHGPMVRNE